MSDEHKIAKSAGEIVKSFYDKHGWQNREGGWSGEDILFRTFPRKILEQRSRAKRPLPTTSTRACSRYRSRGDFGTRATASSCPSNPVWFVGASRRMGIHPKVDEKYAEDTIIAFNIF